MPSAKRTQEITACMFLHRKGRLFIVRRALNKKFLPGVYELPGGHVEFGETMEEGLVREIQEEFSIDIKVGEPFHVFTYTWNKNKKHAVEVVYFASMVNPSQKIKLNSTDHSESQWITKDEVSKYFKKGDEEGIAANKGFNLLYA